MSEVPSWACEYVSRETMDDLGRYVALIKKWNPRINLISKADLANIWERHIWDSAQLLPYGDGNWCDIGSGGGLPGLIAAIHVKHSDPNNQVILIESDQRKSAFLRTVIRELDLPAAVLSERVEHVPPQNADTLSARALASLDHLLDFARLHCAPNGRCVFPKGESWQAEVDDARRNWSFDLKSHKSMTNPNAAILVIRNIARA